MRASGILRRIVVPVEKNWHPTDGPRPRGAKAVIDESTAARLSAVVGDGEFAEFAGVAHGAPEGSATTTAALIRRKTPAAASAVATLACLWVMRAPTADRSESPPLLLARCSEPVAIQAHGAEIRR